MKSLYLNLCILLLACSAHAQKTFSANTKMPPGMEAAMKKDPGKFGQVKMEMHDVFDDLPKLNIMNHADKLTAFTTKETESLAKSMMILDKAKLDFAATSYLDKIAADTSINVAGTGIMMLPLGIPRYIGEYLICKGVLKDPNDPWAVNALGIVFRSHDKYKEAIQMFKHADQLEDSSVTIKTNIGWAVAYYGDFTTAKKYFNAALALDKDFGSALEGLATIAYEEGNKAALFECLARQIKYMGGGGGSGSGPSPSFAKLCGGVQMQSIDLSGKSEDNPMDNHSYDNNNAEDEPGEDYDIANDEPPTYPSFKPIFIYDVVELDISKIAQLQQRIFEHSNDRQKIIKQKKAALEQTFMPYTDAQGNRIIPYSIEQWLNMYSDVSILLSRRLEWIDKQWEKKREHAFEKVLNEDMDMAARYAKELGACEDEGCRNAVDCRWGPQARSKKNSDLSTAAQLYQEYHEKIFATVQWFIESTSPLIKKVRQRGWNDYLNADREQLVRAAILHSYSKWIDLISEVYNTGTAIAIAKKSIGLDCSQKTDTNSDGEGYDPTSKKPRKLKTFAGPCYKEDETTDFIIGKYSDNCERRKLELNAGPLTPFIQQNFNRKFKEDDTFSAGITAEIGKSFEKKLDAKGPAADALKMAGYDPSKAGIEAGMKAQLTYKETWDGSGNLISKEISGEAEASYGATSGSERADKFLGLGSKGVKAGFVATALCGQKRYRL